MSIDDPKVVADDSDPLFQWSGPWFTTSDFVGDLGNGIPFLNTLHGISSNGSLTFSFRGTGAGIWGSLTLRNDTTFGPDPNWRCLFDGSEIQHPLWFPPRPTSNYVFCAYVGATEGNHTLQLNAIVRSGTLYIDHAQYLPAVGVDIGEAWTQIGRGDKRFTYSSDWTSDKDGIWRWTSTSGAWLTYDFEGTDLIWGGCNLGDITVGPGKAQYTIDGEEPKFFTIPRSSDSVNNRLYFNVTGLKQGPHRLTVTNAGDASTAALCVNYIYMKNGGDTTPTSGRGPSAKVIGAAVGGSIGAVLLAVLAILTVIWYRRRQRQREHDASSMGGTTFGKAMSITSGSTDIKELHTPISPTQGPWSQPATPLGPNPPASFTMASPPSPNRPTMFVTPLNPRLQRGPSASSGMPLPASIAAATNGSQSPVSFIASPSGSSPPSPTFINPVSPTAAGAQQNVWPMQVPIQNFQDGRHDHAEYHPNR